MRAGLKQDYIINFWLAIINFICFLDPFLPRICELATSSSDRQTKVRYYFSSLNFNAVVAPHILLTSYPLQIAACELLHALILFTIGKSTQPAVIKKVTNCTCVHILALSNQSCLEYICLCAEPYDQAVQEDVSHSATAGL